MSDDGTIAPVRDEEPGAGDDRRAAEIAEHERQFREILEYCPAGLNVVDEDGRLLFHNARLRRLMGYDEHLFDTKRFWHDLDHRARIIERLRERGGELLDEEAVWKTKEGRLVHVLVSYAQVAYRGGHVSFVGGKRVLWVYDITALREREAQIAEQERQFHDLLEHCPAGLSLVDEEGRLVFHNAGLRALLGYEKEELHLFDTKRFWHDLDHRTRIIETLRQRGGQLMNEEVIWKTKEGRPVHTLMSYVQVAYQGGHVGFAGGKRVAWLYDVSALKQREAQIADQERQFRELLEHCPAGLSLVDEEGRLVFHNARLREMFGYDEEELHLFDTKKFWHDLDHRTRIIETLRERGGQLLNEEVIWKTKEGWPVHTLMSYVQVAYQGGHVGFAGGKRVAWLYDITALRQAEEARRLSEQRLVEAIESISEGFVFYDAEDRLVLVQFLLARAALFRRRERRDAWHDLRGHHPALGRAGLRQGRRGPGRGMGRRAPGAASQSRRAAGAAARRRPLDHGQRAPHRGRRHGRGLFRHHRAEAARGQPVGEIGGAR